MQSRAEQSRAEQSGRGDRLDLLEVVNVPVSRNSSAPPQSKEETAHGWETMPRSRSALPERGEAHVGGRQQQRKRKEGGPEQPGRRIGRTEGSDLLSELSITDPGSLPEDLRRESLTLGTVHPCVTRLLQGQRVLRIWLVSLAQECTRAEAGAISILLDDVLVEIEQGEDALLGESE
eukprot:750298-Hanusia_phi.AAC.2